MAATGLDHHVTVFTQDDIVAAVIVQHRGGTQFGGCTACLGDNIWLHQVHQRLQDGMVGGVHTGVQWESTLPLTVIGRVALGGDDPVQPAKVTEADVELMPAANLSAAGTVAIIKDPWEFVGVRKLVRFLWLPPLQWSRCPRGPHRTLAGPEEGYHERLSGAWCLSSKQTSQARIHAVPWEIETETTEREVRGLDLWMVAWHL